VDPLDCERVRDAVYAYATGVDTRDWSLYRDVFTDEVEIDMQAFTGRPARKMPAERWVAQVAALIEEFDATQHSMTNPRVAIDDDSATCVMYVTAEHVRGNAWYTIGGYYTDRLVRADERWRIEGVSLTQTWVRGDASMMADAVRRAAARRHR
jgi:hypothetical protein